MNIGSDNKALEKLREETRMLQETAKEKVVGYLLTAFGLVAGLAWNEAIKGLIDYLFPIDKNGLQAKFIYAVIITLVVVLVSVYLVRLTKKEKKEVEAEEEEKETDKETKEKEEK